MSIDRLQASQRVLHTPQGDALGCSYRWPGVIGCGLYDCSIATHFGMVVAIARGTPQRPLVEPEDLLEARIAEVSEAAAGMGVVVGMTGDEALKQLLRKSGT